MALKKSHPGLRSRGSYESNCPGPLFHSFIATKIFFIILSQFLFVTVPSEAGEKLVMNQIRQYGQFSTPIDPARVYAVVDMDLSYALASTLVEWDDQKQIKGGIAKSWKKDGGRIFRFSILPNLKWSSGEAVTSQQVKASFERAFKAYPEDLRSLSNMLKAIRAPSADTLEMEVVSETASANLLGKLTEPQYGILFVKPDGGIDPSITTGAYALSHASSEEVLLKRNPNWFAFNRDAAEEVCIRKPKTDFDHQRALLKDTWPNIAQTFSLMPEEIMREYESGGFSIWRRPLDSVYVFASSRSLVSNKLTDLLRYLDQNLDRGKMTKGVAGYKLADQLFPPGYGLRDLEYKPKFDKVVLPHVFKERPLTVLCPGGNPASVHLKNFKAELTRVLGVEPSFQCIPYDESPARVKKGDYDIFFGVFGLADPHPEGLMSFYFEGEVPVVPANASDFIARLDHARNEKDEKKKLAGMRAILRDAKDGGYLLPIFHLSAVGFARGGLDLSHVPALDESMTYSKIRFRK